MYGNTCTSLFDVVGRHRLDVSVQVFSCKCQKTSFAYLVYHFILWDKLWETKCGENDARVWVWCIK